MKLNKVYYLCLLALFMFVPGANAGEDGPPPLPLHGLKGMAAWP